jgi:hypothetical protein
MGLEVGIQGFSSGDHFKNHQGYREKSSVVSNTLPMGSPFNEKHVTEQLIGNPEVPSQDQNFGRPGLSITVSHPDNDKLLYEQQVITHSSGYIHEMQAAHDEHTFTRSNPSGSFQLPLPILASDLPFDICVKRQEMDEQVSKKFLKGLARVKSGLGIETRAPDASLVETFSNSRELVSLFRLFSTCS